MIYLVTSARTPAGLSNRGIDCEGRWLLLELQEGGLVGVGRPALRAASVCFSQPWSSGPQGLPDLQGGPGSPPGFKKTVLMWVRPGNMAALWELGIPGRAPLGHWCLHSSPGNTSQVASGMSSSPFPPLPLPYGEVPHLPPPIR